jgi:hypothetical protein
MGLFGSIFISNMVRIIVNAIFVGKAAQSSRCSLLRFVVANEAINLYNEMTVVKEVYHDMQQKEAAILRHNKNIRSYD